MVRLPDDLGVLLEDEASALGGTESVRPGTRDAARRWRRAMATVKRLYTYALRHPAPNRDAVIREVARQIRVHGPNHVVTRRSREARLFVSWGHAVYREVHAARRSIRFTPGRHEHELVATWHFQYPVVDLVLPHFRRLLGARRLILIDGARAYVHDGCGIRLDQVPRPPREPATSRLAWARTADPRGSALPTPVGT